MVKLNEPVFTAERCALRLRRLQALCKRQELDAIVLIPGPDGNRNSGSNEAISYLLEGRCGREVLDQGRLNPASQEVVLVVSPGSVGMYASPSAHKAFWPTICSSWSNFDLRCSTPEEAEDPDLLDECKIGTFVQLLKGMKKVGIPLTPTKEGAPGMAMEVEQWALIQAYGLEGVGRSGFFTMNFEVTDVFQELQSIYTRLDAHDVDHLLHCNTQLALQHWDEVVQGISMYRPDQRAKLSERQIGEPLLSYYAYGTLRPTAGVKQVLTMMPRVVFGARTATDAEQSSTLTLSAAMAAGDPAAHFAVEAADPKSPLRAARTYFFSCGALPSNCLTEASDEFFSSDKDGKVLAAWSPGEVPRLMALYASLAEAARAAVRHFSHDLEATAQSARQVAVDTLISASKRRGHPLTADEVASRLRYALWAADHTNAVFPAPSRGTPMLKVLRLTLLDGKEAGALVYADTFLEALGGETSEPLILTSGIPEMLCFPATAGETIAIRRVENALRSRLAPADIRPSTASHASGVDGSRIAEGFQGDYDTHLLKAPEEGERLGDLIGSGEEEVVIITGSSALPTVTGRISCFAGGLVIRTRMFPPVVIDFRAHLQALWFQDLDEEEKAPSSAEEQQESGGDATKLGAVIVLQGRPSAIAGLPGAGDFLGIALDSLRLIGRRQMTRAVLPTWEQACREMDITVGNPSGASPFPADLADAHVAGIHWANKVYHVMQPDTKILSALGAMDKAETSALATPCSGVARALAAPTASAGSAPPSGTGIVLVTGLPGSQQEDVVSAFVEFESASYSWQVVHLPLSCGARMAGASLDTSLSKAVEQAEAASSAGSPPRIAVVAECFDSLTQQLEALAATSACSGGRAWLSSTVLCCSSTHLDDARQSTPPGFLEQMQGGLVDSVVLSGPQDSHSMTDVLRHRLPGVPVVRSARGQLVRNLDTLLAPSRSKEAAERAAAVPWAPLVRSTPSGALQAVYIKCRGSLDLSALSQGLQRVGIRESQHPTEPVPLLEEPSKPALQHIFAVKGLVRAQVGGDVQAVTGLAATTARMGQWPLQSAPGAGNGTSLLEDDQPAAELLFIGTHMDAEQCKALVEGAAAAPLGATPLRDAASVTKAESDAIAKEHEGLDLPEGYYFDGMTYLDPFGDRLKVHPCMNDFVEAFLEKQNTEIVTRNQEELAASLTQPLSIELVDVRPISG